jgi:hypothetical protein
MSSKSKIFLRPLPSKILKKTDSLKLDKDELYNPNDNIIVIDETYKEKYIINTIKNILDKIIKESYNKKKIYYDNFIIMRNNKKTLFTDDKEYKYYSNKIYIIYKLIDIIINIIENYKDNILNTFFNKAIILLLKYMKIIEIINNIVNKFIDNSISSEDIPGSYEDIDNGYKNKLINMDIKFEDISLTKCLHLNNRNALIREKDYNKNNSFPEIITCLYCSKKLGYDDVFDLKNMFLGSNIINHQSQKLYSIIENYELVQKGGGIKKNRKIEKKIKM